MNRFALLALVAAFLLTGCSEAPITGPDPLLESPETAASSTTPDVSGTWQWNEVTLVLASRFAVENFFPGIDPEGPITRMTCPSAGVLTAVQNGSSFSGSSPQDPSTCTTQGGQSGPAPFPPFLDLVDGEIRGRSFSFTFVAEGPPGADDILCHYRGAIRVEDGEAVELHGTGVCELPSEFGNPGRILAFSATRT
jgi:hypothetical protein